VLGCLNVLFLAFVVIQIRYLFGGADVVAASDGLTYAEYARQGFFELVTVAGLVLPLLLLIDAFAQVDGDRQRLVLRILLASLVALLFVVMASALQRMRLYQEQFGLTELRLYTTAFMLWLGIVFVWFLATVLRGRRNRFAFGAIVAGLTSIVVLTALNPDGLIARVNIERASASEPLDVEYIASLSADAVPVVVDALPRVNAVDRWNMKSALLARASGEPASDWRSCNLTRERAKDALATIR
jgi:uncharacterized membrane protein